MSTKDGIVRLQKKLLSDVGDSGSAKQVEDAEGGKRRIGETLSTKKVLVVLDDVDKTEHIKKLIGNNLLHSGSRIIITTRDTTILQVQGFKGEIRPYEMLEMDAALALQLFCRHAFGKDSPPEDYKGLSSKIVSSTGGLPLAVEVIGSLLNRNDKGFWEETLIKLSNVPERQILKTLRISYDDLDEDQKQIFLDIACFFFNEKKTEAIYMWTDCKFYPKTGMDVLCNKCLIKISNNDKFWMHDQLIDMGRQIIRQESPSNLVEQSRLWITNEALEVIRTEERKDKVQAADINGRAGILEITNEEFEWLQNLRYLKLSNGTFVGDFAKCRSKLKWLSWWPRGDFRADNMHLDRLVVFKLGKNYFRDDSKAWDLIKRARNLKVLSLMGCHGITTIPDFSKCLSLERLTLAHCSKLKKFGSFIGELESLIELEINECRKLTDLPEEVGQLVKLERFTLQGCDSLGELPSSLGNLTSLIELNLSRTRIRGLSNFIGKLKSLRELHLPQHSSFWQLPSGIGMLESLEVLDLYGLEELGGEIPAEIGELSSLRILNLARTGISGIPGTISRLHHLQKLDLSDCYSIQVLPELPTSLICLRLKCTSLLSVPDLSNLTNLVELQLDHGSWDTKKSKLDLPNVPAPPALASLSNLEVLALHHLDLETVGQLPSSLLILEILWSRIRWTESLTLPNLLILELEHSEVEDIPLNGFPLLEILTVESCRRFRRLSIPSELMKLRQVQVLYCDELDEIQVVGLSKSLEDMSVRCCKSLTRISGLSYLKYLETLSITGCKVLPNVEGLNELEYLKSLEVEDCKSLISLIDASCTKIPRDCVVNIEGCGHSIEDSRGKKPLKRYLEEILLDTKKRPFRIDFHLGVKKPTDLFYLDYGIRRVKEVVTPDSVTYKGLIADVEGFGLRLKRMWCSGPGRFYDRLLEIKSDVQVKKMVQLISERRFIDLYVEVEADSGWEGEYDDELMEMLWPMKTDVYSDQTGAEGDVSSSRRGTTNMGASSRSRKGTASSSPELCIWQIPGRENLLMLDLSRHNELRGEIPAEIGEFSSLRILNLARTGISGISRTINRVHHLQQLNLSDCDSIQVLPELPTSLTCLRLKCTSLLSVPDLSNLTNLVELQLDHGSWDTEKSKLDLPNVPAPPELASLSNLKELTLRHLDLETLGQLPSSLLRLRLYYSRIRWAELLTLTNLSTLWLFDCEVEDIPLDGFHPLETLTVSFCKGIQRLSFPSELRKLQRVDVSHCEELVEIQVVGLSKSLEDLWVNDCSSLTRISGLSYLKNLETLSISFCGVLPNVEGLNELESLKSLRVEDCESLIMLIDASCAKIPGDCVVDITECGDSIEESRGEKPFKRYLEEILLDTKKRPFRIDFHLGVKKPTERFDLDDGIRRVKEDVTSDSVTYKGLIADVEGFGLRLKRMWYYGPGRFHYRLIEIKSDVQVKKMVQLTSERGFVDLFVEVEADSEWEGQYDDELMMMLWPMWTDEYSGQNGAEGNVSSHDEDSVYASEVESETNVTSSIDDFQSEPSKADCFDATGKRSRGSTSGRGTTLERPFTIIFQLGVKKLSGFEFVGGIKREKENVTPDSMTYEGLIADVKGFGFRLKKMWYETPGEFYDLPIEIKSDEQVKRMVQLASGRGFVYLYVEGGVDSEWEGEYTEEMMEMLREEWARKTDVYSNEDGAEGDLSSPDEDSVYASEVESETKGTSSIDDFESEPVNAECFEATGNRRQMRDGRIGPLGNINAGKTTSMENRKKEKDESGEPANQNYVQSSCQRCERVKHHESSYNATTEVEDEGDLSSVKRDRSVETDQIPTKTGRGSGTGRASNLGRDLTETGRGRGTTNMGASSRKGLAQVLDIAGL